MIMHQFLLFCPLLLLCVLHAPVSTALPCFNVTSFVSRTRDLKVDSRSVTICQSTTNEDIYNLVEDSSNSNKRSYQFNRNEVGFLTLKNEEAQFKVFGSDGEDMLWHITCSFSSMREAQDFYYAMNKKRDRPPLVGKAKYFISRGPNPNTVTYVQTKSTSYPENPQYLADRRLSIYCDYVDKKVTIVIKDGNDRPVLVFARDDIYRVVENPESNEVMLEVKHFNKLIYRYLIGAADKDQVTHIASIIQQIERLNVYMYGEGDNDDPPMPRFMNSYIRRIISGVGRN